MPRPAVVREVTVGRDLLHPQFLTIDGEPSCVLVDHPELAVLRAGDSGLAWEGDQRLAMYSWADWDNGPTAEPGRFALFRLELAGDYDLVRVLDAGWYPTRANVAQVVRWLVEHDHRRGYDPKAAVDLHNASVLAESERRHNDWLEGHVADRMAWALKRDGADKYV